MSIHANFSTLPHAIDELQILFLARTVGDEDAGRCTKVTRHP